MKTISTSTITSIRKVLLPRFDVHVAQDIDKKLSSINPSDGVSGQTAVDSRKSVANYWTRIFGTSIGSDKGQAQLLRLANQTTS